MNATLETTQPTAVTPDRIMQTGLAFWGSKVLLTAVKMNLFTLLAQRPMKGTEIQFSLGLQSRGLYDFLDTLVALGFLKRKGIKEIAEYSNAPETELFLDKKKQTYLGGLLVMANNRLYPYWNDLEQALRTGKPQNEVKNGGRPLFEELYSNQDLLKEFISGMSGGQSPNFEAFAQIFDFSAYRTHCDVGGAGADLSAHIVRNNPHIHSTSFDLAPVAPIATANIEKWNLADNITVATGDFFTDAIPQADLITMGNILHDWNLEEKKMLIHKCYEALPVGGAIVVIENIIDDQRRQNAFGLMMSLNMLIETEGGFDYTFSDFTQWAVEAGFRDTEILSLEGPASAAIAYK